MIEIFTNYYGVDWIIFILIVTHIKFLGLKNEWAFPFAIAGCSFGVILGVLVQSIAVVMMNTTFIVMHYITWRTWVNMQKPSATQDHDQN